MTFLPHINGLRAIAVIAVMLYHFKVPFVGSGFVGVDVFFVISGYLMTNILTSQRHTELPLWRALGSFYSGRIRRIVPALVVLSLASLVIFGLTFLPSEFIKLLRSNTTALMFISNFFFRNQSSYFDVASENHPLLHTWSLSVEWQFYLAYPVILFLLRKKSVRTKAAVVGVICVGSLVACVMDRSTDSSSSFFLPIPRAWEFSVGALVSMYHFASIRQKSLAADASQGAAGLVGLAMLTYSIIFLDRSGFPGWQATIPVAASALIIADRNGGALNRLLAIRPIQTVGDISYSLYLWHWPIYVYLVRYVAVDQPLTPFQQILGLGIAAGISMLSYRWIESPFRLRVGFWTNKRMASLYSASCVAAIILLAVGLKTNGMSFRLPDYLVNAEIAMRDQNPRRQECFVGREVDQVALQRPYCAIGSTKMVDVSVALWGDSFANAIQPMVERVLSDRGVSGIAATVAGCAPIDEFPYASPKSREYFPSCATDYNQRVFGTISSTDYKVVVFAAFWQMYDLAILKRRLPVVVCELKRQGKVPIIFGPMSIAEYDVPRTWGARQLQERRVIEEMSMSRAPADNAVKDFQVVVDAIDEQCGAVSIIQPTKHLCTTNKCFAVLNGKALYYDQWHLSRTGAELIANDFTEILRLSLAPQAATATR